MATSRLHTWHPSWRSDSLVKHAAVVVLLALIGAGCALLRLTEPLDLALLDRQFALLRSVLPRPAPEVAVVGIDHETLARAPEPLALWHRQLGAFLTALAAAGPAAVGIDVVLPDRSFEPI